jgi:Tol biopolymer transport system component
MLHYSSGGGQPLTLPISYTAFGSDGYTHIYFRASNGVTNALTSGSHTDQTAQWSFDGTKIVFSRGDSNGSGVYVMNADGSGLTRLSPTPGSDAVPSFSPDGTKIVFTEVISQNTCNSGTVATTSLLTMSAVDGSGRTTIFDGTTAATCFNVEPHYSPDGTKIAFSCGPHSSGQQICTTDTSGGSLTYLTNTSFTVASDPQWNFAGTQLAVSRKDTGGNVNVWTMNADGSSLTQVTTFVEPVEGGDPGWSLDNSAIIFEQDTGGGGQSDPNAPAIISLIKADGSGYVHLGIPCADVGCAPRFQP